jgi:hypothetical protein
MPAMDARRSTPVGRVCAAAIVTSNTTGRKKRRSEVRIFMLEFLREPRRIAKKKSG